MKVLSLHGSVAHQNTCFLALGFLVIGFMIEYCTHAEWHVGWDPPTCSTVQPAQCKPRKCQSRMQIAKTSTTSTGTSLPFAQDAERFEGLLRVVPRVGHTPKLPWPACRALTKMSSCTST